MTASNRKKVDPAAVLFVLSAAFLLFGFGVVVGTFRVFPYALLRGGFDAVQLLAAEVPVLLGRRPGLHVRPARYDGAGVTRLDSDRASPGLTLLSGFFEGGNEVRLIALDGTVVRRWPVRLRETFPDLSHVQPASKIPATDWNVDLHGALALPDGSVVFNYEYVGLVKLDRCGAVEWTVPRMTHHSVERAAGGGFWVPGRRWWEDGSPELAPLRGPYTEDTLLRIAEDGAVLEELSVPGLMLDGGLLPLLTASGNAAVGYVPEQEIVHLNDIEELPEGVSEAFADFAAGDLLLSMRHLNLVLVLDPAAGLVKWHQTGPWLRQHDPDFQPDGTITVFNNNTDDTERGTVLGGSSIIRLDPETRQTEVLYGGTPDQPMYTEARGKHQRLPNGNILITETRGGRILEVAGDGEVVWEFINRYDEESVARMQDALRYPDGYFEVSDWTCAGD